MSMLQTSAVGLLLVVSTSAKYNWTDFNQTGLTPNATRSVTFKPYPEDPEYNSTEWTWRVNITEIPVPDEETDFPVGKPSPKSPNTRAIQVTYDLSWPGGGLLQDPISKDAPGFCVTYPYTISSMPNVTNNWPEANTDSPDCAPSSASPSSLPECNSSFGYHHRHRDSPWGWYGEIDIGIDPSSSSGKRFNWIGYTYDGANNASIYESAVNMLQVVLFHSEAPRPGWLNQTNPSPRRPVLACMRVRTDRLSEERYQRIADGQEGNSGWKSGVDWGVALGALGLAVVMAWAL